MSSERTFRSFGLVCLFGVMFATCGTLFSQSSHNPLNARCDEAWARLHALDQNVVATVKFQYESINLAGRHDNRSEEMLVKKLGDSLLVNSVTRNLISVFSSDAVFVVEKLDGGKYLLTSPVVEPKDWNALGRKPFADLTTEEKSFYLMYLQGIGRLHLAYWPVSFDGNMERCFSDSTKWSEPETIDYNGHAACQFLFESPAGPFFRAPVTGRVLLDQDHDMRWLLLEYAEFSNGIKVGDFRNTFDYSSGDSRSVKLTKESKYVQDGESKFGNRDITEVTRTSAAPDPREFTPEFYGIVFQDAGSSGRGLWMWLILTGAACFLIAVAVYLRRRSTT